MILNRMFENKTRGFFVDVGAHHPVRFSNTYFFFLLGWRGINIDPRPGCMDEFKTIRSEDINLELAVSNAESELVYYEFNESALNTVTNSFAVHYEGYRDFHITRQSTVKAYRLDSILDDHLPENQVIDFLNVDVEGHDLQVLLSNDWLRYRPQFVLVEEVGLDESPANQ